MVGINTHNNKQAQAAKTFTDDSRLSHVCGALPPMLKKTMKKIFT
jgi:hypothetical protein